MKRYLFVCSQNRLRSPTAEQIFAARRDIEVDSAGTNNDAENPLTGELLHWADIIVVMERTHRSKIQRRFRRHLGGKRIVCLDIPDDYAFLDPALIRLLEARMARHLPMAPAGEKVAEAHQASDLTTMIMPEGERPAGWTPAFAGEAGK
uniref:low molecular weight protein tyrosine phosphatase family protein n=1 Tax=Sphingomonas sp. AR_OL41 TaxID=3042729 RepID=UPI0032AFDB5F